MKVHSRHCSSLAASVVPNTYLHKEEECDQCLAVDAQGGPEAVSDQQSPVYPCTEMQKAVWYKFSPDNYVNTILDTTFTQTIIEKCACSC